MFCVDGTTLSRMPESLLFRETPPLPCPECREAGRRGKARIGNQKRRCRLCNSFSQLVLRQASSRLREKYRDEYEALKIQITLDMYPAVVEDYAKKRRIHDR